MFNSRGGLNTYKIQSNKFKYGMNLLKEALLKNKISCQKQDPFNKVS